MIKDSKSAVNGVNLLIDIRNMASSRFIAFVICSEVYGLVCLSSRRDSPFSGRFSCKPYSYLVILDSPYLSLTE